MDSNQDLNADVLHRKAKRANRMAIVSCFLLALFWPVGAFFAWIFLGAAVYFGFLTWFYKNQATPREPDREQEGKQNPYASPSSGGSKSPIPIRFLIPIMVLVIFGVIARMIISSSAHEEKTSEEEPQEVDAEKSPARRGQRR